MLQIYARVLNSGGLPTLVALSVIVLALYAAMAVLDLVRQNILIRVGHKFDDEMGATAFHAYVDAPMKFGPRGEREQPIREVDQLRQFFASPDITALFDMPFMPLYLLVVFMIHPYLGLLSTAGGIVLVAIAIFTNRAARQAVQESGELANRRSLFADSSRRNAEVVRGMGMLAGIGSVWRGLNRNFLRANARASGIIEASSVTTKCSASRSSRPSSGSAPGSRCAVTSPRAQ